VNKPLPVEVSDLAAAQIRAAETWWRLNRPKAPNAIREDLERASSFIAVQPQAGARARKRTYPACAVYSSRELATISITVR
jgi:hypothetical protein